jgi:hypothetical protein
MSSRLAGRTTSLETVSWSFAFILRSGQKSKLWLQHHKRPAPSPGEVMVTNNKHARGFAFKPISFILGALLSATCVSFAQKPTDEPQIQTSELDRQVRDFLQKEVGAHVADIKALDPPPDHVVGALTTGEFSWGTFMRTLGVYSEFEGTKMIAGRDIPQMIRKMAQIELRQGGKTWAQLYAAMALESFGKDLSHNALWQGMASDEKEAYVALLDPGRFYDAKTHKLIHLPENYFGVAARIAAIDYELSLNKDRSSLDDLLNQAAKQFTDGALFADDALPTGRYDRYSNEYARALYDAAELAGREDLLKAVAPSLKEQMKLWWDLLSPDGYGYSWGRSLGAISYMDTMEITAFLAKHPEFRPAPLPQLASAYFAAWSWLRRDFNDQAHLLSIFAFGRGDYGYITKEREWQQTTTFFGKVIGAHQMFVSALEKEGVKSFAAKLSLSDVARFQYFRNDSGRKFGVWVVRKGDMHFALPFVTGPQAATSDYEPAPHGFPAFAVPVEKIYPCFVPFFELEDGRSISPADGADEIRPAPDGKSVAAVWKRWAVAGSKPGETVDSALVSEVTWSLEGNSLHRVESLIASKPLKIRRLWLAIPTRNTHLETLELSGARIDHLTSNGVTLDVQVIHSDWPLQISAYATGNDSLGRGDRGAIPLHLILESRNVSLTPGTAESWDITLSVH